MSLVRCMAVLLVLLYVDFGFSAIDHYAFANEELRARYTNLVKELRCPKCQNQNIADSNSPISMDLREQVFIQLSEGKSDPEIVQYMIDRYGQFIIYRPPVNGKTVVLWFAPVLFLAIGLFTVFMLLRRKSLEKRSVSVGVAAEEARIRRRELDSLVSDEERRG